MKVFSWILTSIIQIGNKSIIIGGDFNLGLTPRDRNNPNPIEDSAVGLLSSFLDKWSLTDIWRELNPISNRQSCVSVMVPPSRIDYIFLSEDLHTRANSATIPLAYRSDHALVQCEFQMDDT